MTKPKKSREEVYREAAAGLSSALANLLETLEEKKEEDDEEIKYKEEEEHYESLDEIEDGYDYDYENKGFQEGILSSSGDPCWEGYIQIGMKKGKNGRMVPNCVPKDSSEALDYIAEFADASGGSLECPPATRDIELNIKNRQNAIDNVGYGPLNPLESNNEFWQEKADRWNTTPEEAKTATCGNCAFFVRTEDMLACISSGMSQGVVDDVEASINQAELGYCQALDFKCAASRTCNAWASGGPVTSSALISSGLIDRFETKKVEFGDETARELKSIWKSHIEKSPPNRRVPLSVIKVVYRRGALSYDSPIYASATFGISRHQWGIARVNFFLRTVTSERLAREVTEYDVDLLPIGHRLRPISTNDALVASVKTAQDLEKYAENLLFITLMDRSDYESDEAAIISLTEFSGLGYDVEQSIRSSWKRAMQENSNPFDRALDLSVLTYLSKDADLLPKRDVI